MNIIGLEMLLKHTFPFQWFLSLDSVKHLCANSCGAFALSKQRQNLIEKHIAKESCSAAATNWFSLFNTPPLFLRLLVLFSIITILKHDRLFSLAHAFFKSIWLKMNLLCIHVMNVLRAHSALFPWTSPCWIFQYHWTNAANTGKIQIPSPKLVKLPTPKGFNAIRSSVLCCGRH